MIQNIVIVHILLIVRTGLGTDDMLVYVLSEVSFLLCHTVVLKGHNTLLHSAACFVFSFKVFKKLS